MTHRLSDSDRCQVLSCTRRRLALEYLWDAAETTPLTTLAEVVAAAEAGVDPAPRPVRESVYTSLRKTHLPTLARHGLVELDDRGLAATVTPQARELVRYIRDEGPFGLGWSDLYRTVGVLGLFAVVVTLSGVFGLDAVDPLIPAVLALFAYALSSAYHVWTLRPRGGRATDVADTAAGWQPTDA